VTARDEKALLRERVEKAVGALFEVEEEIGRGGMAVVYRARDVRLRRRVALKVLPPELAYREDVKNRFLREAQMSAQLSHPNIVPIFTVDELDGVVFFAMGLVEGETLAQQLAQSPRPTVAAVRALMREVADALAYAHGRHVVHRDVKPDNILVDRATGRAMVSDFGIARAAEGDSRLTVTGIAVGTPAYMSPEQAMGERDVDGRADIYSLGVVGYQMLAGELPFQAANTPAMLMKHISERPRPLHEMRADLPANLVYAIERAMAKGRNERWPDAAAFRDALDERAQAGVLPRDSRPLTGASQSAGRYDDRPAGDSADARPEQYPRFPALPPGWMFNPDTRQYGRDALREWREQQRLWRKQRAAGARDSLQVGVALGSRLQGLSEIGIGINPYSRREGRRADRELRRAEKAGLVPVTPEERIRRVQRAVMGYITTVGFLFAINMLTSPRFPWVVFPALGMGVGLVARISSLWVDGISVRRLFQRQPHVAAVPTPAEPDNARSPMAAPLRIAPSDLAGVPREVLDGPHGAAIREAAESKAIIVDVLAKLSDADRKMLPEIQPTVDALVDRIRSLAQSLHQLDGDASPQAIAKLEQRIAQSKGTSTDTGERRLELLERQLATLKDLAARRTTVAEQLESATVVLQTMRLDLLKLRSSGLDAKLDASTGATQEARALSTDIGRVIDAANEVRKL
jgi:serine/threonine protein kinase